MVVTITTYCVVEIQTDWINYNFYFALAKKSLQSLGKTLT